MGKTTTVIISTRSYEIIELITEDQFNYPHFEEVHDVVIGCLNHLNNSVFLSRLIDKLKPHRGEFDLDFEAMFVVEDGYCEFFEIDWDLGIHKHRSRS